MVAQISVGTSPSLLQGQTLGIQRHSHSLTFVSAPQVNTLKFKQEEEKTAATDSHNLRPSEATGTWTDCPKSDECGHCNPQVLKWHAAEHAKRVVI